MDFDALKTFVGEQTAAFIIILLALLGALVYIIVKIVKISKWVAKVNNYPCQSHSAAIEKHTDDVSDIKADLSKIDGKLSVVVSYVTSNKTPQIITNTFSEKNSPRVLNENGVALLSEVSGEQFIKDNQSFFLSEIEKLTPKTALDVENYSLAILRVNSNNDIFIPIKNWVYNAPSREMIGADGTTVKRDVSLDDVLFVLSLPLRDRYLSTHPEIKS